MARQEVAPMHATYVPINVVAGVSGDDLTYLTSLGSGTWSGFSRCAFLVGLLWSLCTSNRSCRLALDVHKFPARSAHEMTNAGPSLLPNFALMAVLSRLLQMLRADYWSKRCRSAPSRE